TTSGPAADSPTRPRIAVVGPTYPFRGGIAHYTTLLARHLRLSSEVLLLTFTSQYPPRLFPGRTDRDPSTSVVSDDAIQVLAPLRPDTWRRAARVISEFQPDLVVIQWWVPFWAPSLATVAALTRRETGATIAFVCHNVLPHEGRGALQRLLTRLALGRGQRFVVHSQSDEDDLRRLLPRQTAPEGAVVRGCLPEHTIATAVGRSDARRALGLAEDEEVILFFGFVRPYKGLDGLIEALPRIAARVPRARLVVAGEFWIPADDFVKRASELGVAGMLTIDDRYVPNEDVGTYFAAADVVAMPYVSATQSGVVTLAAQFGLPVVATDVGGLPEAVVDGETGLVVPPGEPGALADALVRCLSEDQLASELGAGLAAARGRFDWAPTVAAIESMAGTPLRNDVDQGGMVAGSGL
ncbi:MAG: glycosyltransferase, partial [Anaerolineae bacterium]